MPSSLLLQTPAKLDVVVAAPEDSAGWFSISLFTRFTSGSPLVSCRTASDLCVGRVMTTGVVDKERKRLERKEARIGARAKARIY
jgi:hypothetical protein